MNLLLFLDRWKTDFNPEKRNASTGNHQSWWLFFVSSGWLIPKSEWLLPPCLEEPEPELIIHRKLLGVAGGP